jgi:hypothetical protein
LQFRRLILTSHPTNGSESQGEIPHSEHRNGP